MKIVSSLLPQSVRHRLRRQLDSLYSKKLPDKETIGDLSQWTIVTRDMRPDAVIYSGGVGEDITFDLLKIDIEGFEYEVLESCWSADIPIKQICVEFHDFFPEIPRRKPQKQFAP